MNGLFSGLLGGNRPMNITPQMGGGLFGGGALGKLLPPGFQNKLQGMQMPNMGGLGPRLSQIGQNAQSPMTQFGMGMMGGGGWSGGIQPAMQVQQAQRQQQLRDLFQRMMMGQGGGMGGGNLPPASIY